MGLLPNTFDFIPANQAPLRFLFPFEANSTHCSRAESDSYRPAALEGGRSVEREYRHVSVFCCS